MDERLQRARRRAVAVLRRFWPPALKLALVFVTVQVIFSQSRTAQTAWVRAKRRIPDPVLEAADAVAETPVGRVVGHASAGVHAGANWALRPFRSTVAEQQERGRQAAEAAAEYRRRLEELERTSPRAPQRVIGAAAEQ